MISFIIGGVVGVTIALFIAGASRSNHDNYIYIWKVIVLELRA